MSALSWRFTPDDELPAWAQHLCDAAAEPGNQLVRDDYEDESDPDRYLRITLIDDRTGELRVTHVYESKGAYERYEGWDEMTVEEE